MTPVKFRLDRLDGGTQPLSVTITSDAEYGAVGAGGVGKARSNPLGIINAGGWLTLPDGKPYYLTTARPNIDPVPPNHRLTVRDKYSVVAQISFLPILSSADATELDINQAMKAGKALAATPEQLAEFSAALAEMKATTELYSAVVGIQALGREPAEGDPAGIYRVGAEDVQWDGASVTGRTAALATHDQLQSVHTATASQINAVVAEIENRNQTLTDLVVERTDTATSQAQSAVGQANIAQNMAMQAARALATDRATLALRSEIDGPQFADGSRWLWSQSGTPDGGLCIAAQDGGYWHREKQHSTPVYASEFGVVADGLTNCSVQLQAAIDAAAARGGGVIVLGAGVTMANVVIRPNITLQGQGVYATVLRGVNGANKDVIYGENFTELHANAPKPALPNQGCNNVQLRDLTIDGNKTNNTNGLCIRIWGRSFVFENVIFKNGPSGNIWTAYSTHDAPKGERFEDYALESVFRNIKSLNSGGNGWLHHGPHDSKLYDYVAFGNRYYAFRSERGPNYSGGIGGGGWNSWLNEHSFYFGADVTGLTDIIASGPYTGVGIELVEGLGSCRINNSIVGGHEIGMILRGANHMINGQVSDCRNVAGDGGVGIMIDGLISSKIDVTTAGCKSVVQYTNKGSYGPNSIHIVGTLAPGGVSVAGGIGSVPATDEFCALIAGAPSQNVIRTPIVEPGEIRLTSGVRPQWPNSSGVLLTDAASDAATPTRRGTVKQVAAPTADAQAIIEALKAAGVFS